LREETASPPSRLVSTSRRLSNTLETVFAVGASYGMLYDRQNIGHASRRVVLGPPGRAELSRVSEPTVEAINLASNSYLGLGGDPDVRAAVSNAVARHGTHMGGSRILCGTAEIHWEFEQRLAHFFEARSVVTYSSGYVANVSTISTLFGPGDLVVLDRNAHRSIYDGALLSGATIRRFAHNDVTHLERLLRRDGRSRRTLVAVDGVYSMEGHIAPLPDLVEVTRTYEAFLLVDDAHAIGVVGRTGKGTFEHFGIDPDAIDIRVGTLSKAIPAVGGFVATRPDVAMVLRYASHGTLYSAPVTPADVAACIAAIDIMQREPERVRALQEKAATFRAELSKRGLNTLGSQTAIVPIWTGNQDVTLAAAAALLRRGVYVNPVIHPGIRRGTERLRCFVMATHTGADLEYAADAIGSTLTPAPRV